MIYKQTFRKRFQVKHGVEQAIEIQERFDELNEELHTYLIAGLEHQPNEWYDKKYIRHQDAPFTLIKDYKIVDLEILFLSHRDDTPKYDVHEILVTVFFIKAEECIENITTLLKKVDTLESENCSLKVRLQQLEERYSYQGEH